jgi:hypothetical protein
LSRRVALRLVGPVWDGAPPDTLRAASEGGSDIA